MRRAPGRSALERRSPRPLHTFVAPNAAGKAGNRAREDPSPMPDQVRGEACHDVGGSSAMRKVRPDKGQETLRVGPQEVVQTDEQGSLVLHLALPTQPDSSSPSPPRHSGQRRRERGSYRTFGSSSPHESAESQPGNILRDGARSTRERKRPCACGGTRCPAGREDRARAGETGGRDGAKGDGPVAPGECLCRGSSPSTRCVEAATTDRRSSQWSRRIGES